MSDSSHFQDRYHIQLQGRRTTITMDKILSELIAMSFGVTPDHADYHQTVQQWLQGTLRDKLGDNVPSGSSLSQWARKYAIEEIANPTLMEKVWDFRLGDG